MSEIGVTLSKNDYTCKATLERRTKERRIVGNTENFFLAA